MHLQTRYWRQYMLYMFTWLFQLDQYRLVKWIMYLLMFSILWCYVFNDVIYLKILRILCWYIPALLYLVILFVLWFYVFYVQVLCVLWFCVRFETEKLDLNCEKKRSEFASLFRCLPPRRHLCEITITLANYLKNHVFNCRHEFGSVK